MEILLGAIRAAGEATRLRILALLEQGELTVGEIVQILDQSQPRVSRHLKLMCEAGLLDRTPEGTLVFYRLSNNHTAATLNRALMALLPASDDILIEDNKALQSIRLERAEAAQRYFKEHADTWDEIRSLYVPEASVEEAILKLVGARKYRRVLDVGTGTGRMLELFAPNAEQALGVDISRDMLAVARGNLAGKELNNCQVQQGDMYDLPVAPASQNLIIFHQVLHFAEDPAKAIKEAAAALAVGGLLLIADFAPHEEEFLRTEHAHRRLGFADDDVTGWAQDAGLSSNLLTHLDGGKLRVTLWSFEKTAHQES